MSSPASPGPAPTRMISRPCCRVIQFVFEDLLRRRLVTGLHQAGKAAAKHAPRSDGVPSRWSDAFSDGCASSWPFRHASEAGRQQRFDFFSQHARQHRAVPPGDRHQQRRWRSTIDGKINEHNGWSSTTFTEGGDGPGCVGIRLLSARSSVAAITSTTLSI